MKRNISKYILRKTHFTMVEMLTAMGVLSLVMVSLMTLLDQSQRAMTIGMSKMDVYQDAKLALDMMQDDISSIDIEQTQIKLGDRSKDEYKPFCIESDSKFHVFCVRYNVTSEFCKVVYEWDSNQGELKQTIYKVTKEGDSYDVDQRSASTTILLNNVYYFNVSFRDANDDNTLEGDKMDNSYSYLDKQNDTNFDRGIFLDLQLVDRQMLAMGKTVNTDERDGLTTDVKGKIENAIWQTSGNKATMADRVHSFTRYVYMDLSYLNK